MPTPPRRRWSYSLRTLFVVVTAFAVWLGWELKLIRDRKAFLDPDQWNRGASMWDEWARMEPWQKELKLPFWRKWLGDELMLELGIFKTADVEEARSRFPEAAIIDLDSGRVYSDTERRRLESAKAPTNFLLRHHPTRPRRPMNRYSAKLLFQFRVTKGGDSGKRRLCEERIISINAPSARDALAKAKRSGLKSQHQYKNDDGNPVRFEFIGVVELLHLGVECAADEVWYDITERLRPLERRRDFIPPESQLSAIAQENNPS